MLKKQILIFVGLSILSFSIFYFTSVQVFDGVIDFESGAQKFSVEKPLSLSDLFNKNSQEAIDAGVKDVRLKPVGWMLLFILIIGLPILISYRIGLRKRN